MKIVSNFFHLIRVYMSVPWTNDKKNKFKNALLVKDKLKAFMKVLNICITCILGPTQS